MTSPVAVRDAMRRLIVAHGALDPSSRPCGTPLPTPWAWALLELREGPKTVSDLAGHLDIDRANVSRLAARMEAAGDLARRPHPTDGRARLLVLTDKGEAVAAQVDRASAARFEGVLARLGDDAADVLRVLETLTAALAPREGG
jgi:DNA-binding MarR family transcriptional regulator